MLCCNTRRSQEREAQASKARATQEALRLQQELEQLRTLTDGAATDRQRAEAATDRESQRLANALRELEGMRVRFTVIDCVRALVTWGMYVVYTGCA